MWMFVAAGPLAHMHVRQQAATQACTQGGSTCNPPICTVIQCTPRPQSRLVQGDCCRNPLKLSMLLPAVLQCSNVLCHASRSLPEFKARQRGLLTTSMQQRPPPCCGPSHCTLPCIPPPRVFPHSQGASEEAAAEQLAAVRWSAMRDMVKLDAGHAAAEAKDLASVSRNLQLQLEAGPASQADRGHCRS